MSMTPEQKIIAIAEFEGWKYLPTTDETYDSWRKPDADKYVPYWCSKPPPYLTSRDAICGAVARLPDLLRSNFNENLAKRIGGKVYEVANDDDMLFQFATATPTQLADALLLTLGHKI